MNVRSFVGSRCGECLLGGLLVFACDFAAIAYGSEILMKDGRILRGMQGETFGLAEMIDATDSENGNIKNIVFVHDDMRMIFVPRQQIQEVGPDKTSEANEVFQIKHPSPHGNLKVMSVGPAAGPITDFDAWGRRIFPMQTANGKLDVIQAITVISPLYVKVVGLNVNWDMRVATNTLSSDLISKILLKQIDPKNLEHRKKIVRFWLQSKRYDQAEKELAKILEDFKGQTDIQQQLAATIKAVAALSANQILKELDLRKSAGQHKLVKEYLQSFDKVDKGADGETLQKVLEIKKWYATMEARRIKVLSDCRTLAESVSDPALHNESLKLVREMTVDLDIDTLPNMAAYMQNADSPGMGQSEKLSLALSGWLLGADGATPNLKDSIALLGMREKAVKYVSAANKIDRDRIMARITRDPAVQPQSIAKIELIAKMLNKMKPPMGLPDLVEASIPGYYRLQVNTVPGELPVDYLVQLPPEYNPYHRYPAIVSLHGLNSTAEMQIEWWAGAVENGQRRGQATRQGYVVIAPDWTQEHQKEYAYSAREHAAVLSSLRDALRRFSIDSDRVFLSGHMAGGDAAWDIGAAHPDLWAGVIPISAEANNYCKFYVDNVQNLPFYVVLGEFDGGHHPGATIMKTDSLVLDRYLQKQKGYNVTVVEYLGRGQDHFVDEQLPIFDWMSHMKRNFFPKEFKCATMRPWDNFFWWVELKSLPPAVVVIPAAWPPPRNTHPLLLQSSMPTSNNINVQNGNVPSVIWLSPEMIDFKSRISINANGRRVSMAGGKLMPSVETMLEDVRARGDRQHPFWAKVELSGMR